MSSPTAWPKPRTSSLVNSCIPASRVLRQNNAFPRAKLSRYLRCAALVLDLQNHLNLNAGAVGQRCQAHLEPGMGSSIAVELAQQGVGSARHPGLLAELRCGIDHTQQLGHPFLLIQIAYDGLHVG